MYYFCNTDRDEYNCKYTNMDNNAIRDRFKMVIDREKLTAGEFAERIGVAPSTISHILGARNKYPSTEVLLKLCQKYEDINIEWLLTGKGSMCNGQDADRDVPPSEYPLFADNIKNDNSSNVVGKTSGPQRMESLSAIPPVESIRKEIIYKERPPRKITEIRIFFDDNTYETFKPE